MSFSKECDSKFLKKELIKAGLKDIIVIGNKCAFFHNTPEDNEIIIIACISKRTLTMTTKLDSDIISSSDKIPEMDEFINRINSSLPIGKFTQDYDTKSIWFTISIPFLSTISETGIYRLMITAICHAYDIYILGFVHIAAGFSSPSKEIVACNIRYHMTLLLNGHEDSPQ